jgi:hypothetical protein
MPFHVFLSHSSAETGTSHRRFPAAGCAHDGQKAIHRLTVCGWAHRVQPSERELDTGSKSLESIHKPVTDTRNGGKFER